MQRLTVIAILAMVLAMGWAGCGSNNDCATTAIEVHFTGGDRDGEIKCRKTPTSCNTRGTCSDTICLADMLALCDAPYHGVTCSDTEAPTVITCNPN